jgi:hypothetical protein
MLPRRATLQCTGLVGLAAVIVFAASFRSQTATHVAENARANKGWQRWPGTG